MLQPKDKAKAMANWRAMQIRAYEKAKAKKEIKKAVTDPYFEYHMKNARGVCENCGDKIPFWQRRMSQAHILPKREDYGFPSVAGNLDNHMELGVECGCHDLYDRTWDDAVKMKIFIKAVERYRLFAHLIAEEEISRIPDCFKNAHIVKHRQIKTLSHYE